MPTPPEHQSVSQTAAPAGALILPESRLPEIRLYFGERRTTTISTFCKESNVCNCAALRGAIAHIWAVTRPRVFEVRFAVTRLNQKEDVFGFVVLVKESS